MGDFPTYLRNQKPPQCYSDILCGNMHTKTSNNLNFYVLSLFLDKKNDVHVNCILLHKSNIYFYPL